MAIRGGHEAEGRAFFVKDASLFEVFENGSFINRGSLVTASGNVAFADNGLQLVFVDGPNGYIFSLSTNSLSQIVSEGWLGATSVCFIDGYFIFNKPNTQQYYISALYDGSSIDGLDFASAEGAPDDLIAVHAVHKELWLLGENSVEVAQNTGAADFPFERIDGAFIEYGCAAAASVASTANTIFWLGQDKQGFGLVWMAEGYQPKRVSSFALEFAIQGYENVQDAVGYTYQEDGHYFYVLNFPSANTTWVFDINNGQWHERAFWNTTTGQYERHRGQCHVGAFGKHLIGDYATGKVYEQSLNYLDDNGNVIRRMRTSPHVFDSVDLNYITYHRFQLDMQVGVGSSVDPDPQIMLQWSDDGGYSWSNEHARPIGVIGAYKTRAIWRRLGRGRDRVWRVITSARAKLTLIAAHVAASKGIN
jgi:hypothetical protein